MKFGHHGGNHPVKDVEKNVVMIAARTTVLRWMKQHYLQTCVSRINPCSTVRTGIHRTDKPAFSFQGHPEASPGPHDAAPLFDHFIELIEQYRKTAK
ncbi:glutamine amidotransferase-related protein [Escherichia coli]